MRSIIPKDSRYLPIVQERYHCVPACILMILHRRTMSLVPQQLLGYHLGMRVPKKDAHLFFNARTGKKPSSGYGTRIGIKEYSIEAAFKKLGIPLAMTFHPISSFDDEAFIRFIGETTRKDKDIILCFDAGALNGTRKKGGHVCVLDAFDPAKKQVRIIDPSPRRAKWRLVSVGRLKRAMERHGDKNFGGFWEFTKSR